VSATTHEGWLAAHGYLQPLGEVCALVENAAARVPAAWVTPPHWPEYLPDFHAGIPLLLSDRAALEIGDPVQSVLSMLETLRHVPLPAPFSARCHALEGDLRMQDDPEPRVEAGLFRVLLWTVAARCLRPVIAEFAEWRDEERWLRAYCPTCGEPPAMAQLAGQDPGRLRLLSCGCCRTRWRYKRMTCPFCERADDHRLSVIAVEGERPLRIDYCESCRGYLKTYDGQGSEDVFLADWTSLHLDVIARDRGLNRRAASLYEV
jgi:FdhE protein